MVVGWTLLKWSWNRSHSHLVNCRDHNVISCKSPAWFATIFNSSGFCNISIEIQKIHGDGHQIICALLPFLDTRYVQPQFYFYNYVIPPSSCFLSAKKSWTASWPYEQNFVDFSIHVNVFFIILAWFIQHLTQILGPFVYHLALWFFPSTYVWCHFHECVYLKTIKTILSGSDTVWWHLAYFYYCIIYEYFFFTIESTSVKILKVFDHIKFCEATDFSSFCCDIGLQNIVDIFFGQFVPIFFSPNNAMSVSFKWTLILSYT